MVEGRRGVSFYSDNIGPPYIRCNCGSWVRTKASEWSMMPLLGKALVLAKLSIGAAMWSMIGAVAVIAFTDWTSMGDMRDAAATAAFIVVVFLHIRHLVKEVDSSNERMSNVGYSDAMRALNLGDANYLKKFVK